jgi:O-antigen/teichoic acid export membrane protein
VQYAFAQCLPFLLLVGYSVHEVGVYFVAMRIAGGPISLLSAALSSSFWGEAAELAQTDPVKLRRLYLNVLANLTILFIPVGIACLAAPLFLPAILGGREWSEIGIALAACLPQVAGMFIFSSTTHLIVYGRPGYQLLSNIVSIAGSVVVLLVVSAWALPFTVAIFGMSCMMLCAYLLRFAFHLKANAERVRAFERQ